MGSSSSASTNAGALYFCCCSHNSVFQSKISIPNCIFVFLLCHVRAFRFFLFLPSLRFGLTPRSSCFSLWLDISQHTIRTSTLHSTVIYYTVHVLYSLSFFKAPRSILFPPAFLSRYVKVRTAFNRIQRKRFGRKHASFISSENQPILFLKQKVGASHRHPFGVIFLSVLTSYLASPSSHSLTPSKS